MNKIYEIKLTLFDRFFLFQSGVLSFKQLFIQKIFSLNQIEIQCLIERNDQAYVLWFERNNLFHALRLNKEDHGLIFSENKHLISPGDKIPWKIFKHTLAAVVCIFVACFPAAILSSLINPKNLKPLFISETCYAPCANLMTKLTYLTTAPYGFILGIPLFYIITCFIAIKLFKFKINRPEFFVIVYILLTVPFMSATYNMLDKPSVRKTFSHWQKGTLNLETVSQIKQEFSKEYSKEFKVKRMAESSSSNNDE